MLVVLHSICGEGLAEDLVLCADLFEAFSEIRIILIKRLWVVLSHEKRLIVEKVLFQPGSFKGGQIVKREGADVCANNENLVISWRAHLCNFTLRLHYPEDLIGGDGIQDY